MKAPPQIMVSIPMPDLGAITLTAPLPETITQRNVESITGVPATIYLKMVREPGFPLIVARKRQLRIVDRVAFVAWLLSQNDETQRVPANDIVDPVDELATASGLVPSTPRTRRR